MADGFASGETRPRVVLVTGAPGSGKTTLATELARHLRVPFLARDDVRGGLLMTAGAWSESLQRVPSSDEAVAVFLDTAATLIQSGVSCVLEYVVRQHRPEDLDRLSAVGDIRVVQTWCADPLERVRTRNLSDPLIAQSAVLAATGHSSVAAHTEDVVARMQHVIDEMRTDFGVPVMRVCTDGALDPPLDEIVDFVIGGGG